MESPNQNNRSSEAGFGVIELSVVVAIAAIVIGLSVVAFGSASARYQLNQKAQNIVWQIERARSIALKYNQTLTLGFSSRSKSIEFTCDDCREAQTELPAMSFPEDVNLSAYPTLTFKGNGTITSTAQNITLTDVKGRQITITINNSGRVTTSDIIDE